MTANGKPVIQLVDDDLLVREVLTEILTDHGWNVVPGGTTTCAKPGTGPGE